MKRKLIIIGAILFLNSFIFSEGFKVGGSLKYYSVSDQLFRDIYGSGNVMLGGFISYEVLKRFEIRGDIYIFKDKGETTLTKEEIDLSILPIAVGIRYQIFQGKNLYPYLGIGMDFYSYKETARIGKTSDSTFGFHIEAGSYIDFGQKFYIDVGVRYIKADAKPFEEEIGLGGFSMGMGVGYRF